MGEAPIVDATEEQLVAFIRSRLLRDGKPADFDADTPLLESGILDSLKAAILLNHIRKALGVTVPHQRIDTEHFRTVRDISALIAELRDGRDVP